MLKLTAQYCQLRPENRGLNLSSFLLLPIQRLCKYPLLIKELLKQTSKTHQDYKSLSMALEQLEATVNLINDRKREIETRREVSQILSKLDLGDHVLDQNPSRALVHRGFVTKMNPHGVRKDLGVREAILLSDVILIVKPQHFGKSVVSNVWKVSETQVRVISGETVQEKHGSQKTYFEMTGFGKKPWCFSPAGQQDKRLWTDALSKVFPTGKDHKDHDSKETINDSESTLLSKSLIQLDQTAAPVETVVAKPIKPAVPIPVKKTTVPPATPIKPVSIATVAVPKVPPPTAPKPKPKILSDTPIPISTVPIAQESNASLNSLSTSNQPDSTAPKSIKSNAAFKFFESLPGNQVPIRPLKASDPRPVPIRVHESLSIAQHGAVVMDESETLEEEGEEMLEWKLPARAPMRAATQMPGRGKSTPVPGLRSRPFP